MRGEIIGVNQLKPIVGGDCKAGAKDVGVAGTNSSEAHDWVADGVCG